MEAHVHPFGGATIINIAGGIVRLLGEGPTISIHQEEKGPTLRAYKSNLGYMLLLALQGATALRSTSPDPTLEARKLVHDRPPTKGRRNASMTHPTSMFQLLEVCCN